jgi:hypothetical protein
MENEVYQEYFSSKRNKVSLAMWVLINNNVVSSNIFVLMILIELVFNLIITLGLYYQVGCMPSMSSSIMNILDYSNA